MFCHQMRSGLFCRQMSYFKNSDFQSVLDFEMVDEESWTRVCLQQRTEDSLRFSEPSFSFRQPPLVQWLIWNHACDGTLLSSGAEKCFWIVNTSKQCFPSEQKEKMLFTSSLCCPFPPPPHIPFFGCVSLLYFNIFLSYKSGTYHRKENHDWSHLGSWIYDNTYY